MQVQTLIDNMKRSEGQKFQKKFRVNGARIE